MLSEVLTWKDYAYNISKWKQKLFYIEEKNEVDKNQIIKIIIAEMNLIFYKNEVIFITFTKIAADNISRNICHIVLDINLDKKQKLTVSSHIRKLWSNKTIMFVNEISMMNLSMLNKINNQYKITKFLNKSSSNLFDELLIIIFMRNFYQFLLIRESALWKKSRKNNNENAND